MPDLKVISISHSIDPDGIGSQAILFRYFRELQIEPIGYLADYYNIVEVITKAIEEKPNVLIISDIGINDSYIHQIIEPLRNLNAKKIWIDHHKLTKEHKRLLEEVIDELIHDTSVSASIQVFKRFMPQDKISKRIAEVGHNGDYDVADRLAEIFYTIIDYYRNDMNKLFEVRELFADGTFLQEDKVLEIYLEAYKVFEAERDRLKQDTTVLDIAGKSVVVGISRLLPRGKVTKFLSEFRTEDIICAVDPTKNRIGLRSEVVDVAAIALALGGGGHKNRSGFNYKNALKEDDSLTTEFVNDLTKAVEKVLATE